MDIPGTRDQEPGTSTGEWELHGWAGNKTSSSEGVHGGCNKLHFA